MTVDRKRIVYTATGSAHELWELARFVFREIEGYVYPTAGPLVVESAKLLLTQTERNAFRTLHVSGVAKRFTQLPPELQGLMRAKVSPHLPHMRMTVAMALVATVQDRLPMRDVLDKVPIDQRGAVTREAILGVLDRWTEQDNQQYGSVQKGHGRRCIGRQFGVSEWTARLINDAAQAVIGAMIQQIEEQLRNLLADVRVIDGRVHVDAAAA